MASDLQLPIAAIAGRASERVRMIGNLRMIIVLPVLITMTVVLIPVQYLLVRFATSAGKRLPMWWHSTVLHALGVRVHISGALDQRRPLLLIANHLSWSDIMVFGSVCELSFIAKQEVRSMPGLNILAILQRSVFVDRNKRLEVGMHVDTIAARLVGGDCMVLFAEGTTGDGVRILRFRSALIGAAQSALAELDHGHVVVQPVAIAYTHLHGLPLGRAGRMDTAWPGDLDLMPHLWKFLRNGAYDVTLSFGAGMDFTAGSNRKHMATEAEALVNQLYYRAVSADLPNH